MAELSRRGFIVAVTAASVARALPTISRIAPQRRILTLVYDKSLGMMRAVERLVP